MKRSIKDLFGELFCKHYYVVIEDKFDNAGKRMINHYGYCSMKSQCRLCGKILEHD